ncbi:MAG: Fic family protein [Bacteroidales bacterium]
MRLHSRSWSKILTEQVPSKYRASTEQVPEQVLELLSVMREEHSRTELMEALGLSHREHFRANYINKALSLGVIELTIPDKPNSSKQKYRLTAKGIECKTK